MKINFFMIISIILFINISLSAQNNTTQRNLSQSEKPTSNQLEQVKKNKDFNDAKTIIEESGAQINFENVKVLNMDKKNFELKFEIIDLNNSLEEMSLVCSNINGSIYVVFEDNNPNFKKNNSNGNSNARGILGLGCNWTSWADILSVPQDCIEKGCFRKKKLVKKQERSCMKNNVARKYETRWKKVDCDC